MGEVEWKAGVRGVPQVDDRERGEGSDCSKKKDPWGVATFGADIGRGERTGRVKDSSAVEEQKKRIQET